MFCKNKNLLQKKEKESIQLKNENITEFALVTFRDGVDEGKIFSNKKKDPMTLKELNKAYELWKTGY